MASNSISILIQAKDQASATLSRLSTSLAGVKNQSSIAAGGLSKLNSATDDNSSAASGLSTRWLKGAAATAAASLSIGALTGQLRSSLQAANAYQGALTGLTSVAAAFGQDQTQAKQAAQELASDGLMTVTDAATGLKNLLASGYGLDQAIVIMNKFKDTAAFGRQSALGFGESIRGATEGIKNGNSILVDNAGVTKNLSVILEEAGYSAQDLMKASSDAGVRQAIFNGIMRESAAQTGDAAKLSSQYAGSQARAGAVTETFRQQLGGVVQIMTGGLLSSYTNLVGNNQQMIISLGLAVTAAGLFAGGLYVAIAAIRAFSLASIVAAATNPLILALTAIGILAGGVVYKAVDKMQAKLTESNGKIGSMGNTLGKTMPAQSAQAGKALSDLSKKLKDIDDNAAKATRTFRESMADMIRGHQDKSTDLKKQLSEENAAFAKSSSRQASEFKASQDDIQAERDKKLGPLQQQLDQELALGDSADQYRLATIRQRLAEESTEYDKSIADKKLKYDQDVADEKEAHDKKVADLQAQLNTETALLNAHAADVAAIRDVQLLDEIDKLKRSHDEQLASFAQQRNDAIANAKQTASGVSSVWDGANAGLNTQFAGMGNQMGAQMGEAFKSSMKMALKEVGADILAFLKEVGLSLGRVVEAVGRTFTDMSLGDLVKNKGNLLKMFQEQWDKSVIGGNAIKLGGARAKGGPVSAGMPYLVGEQGPELVIPRQAATVMPASQTSQMMQSGGKSGGGVTIEQLNVNNNIDVGQVIRQMGWALATR